MSQKPKKKTKLQKYKEALQEIASLGEGIKEELRDYKNIGKNAKYIAGEALREKCSKCGR